MRSHLHIENNYLTVSYVDIQIHILKSRGRVYDYVGIVGCLAVLESLYLNQTPKNIVEPNSNRKCNADSKFGHFCVQPIISPCLSNG